MQYLCFLFRFALLLYDVGPCLLGYNVFDTAYNQGSAALVRTRPFDYMYVCIQLHIYIIALV